MRLNKRAYDVLTPETRDRLERLSGEKIEIATPADLETRRQRRVSEKLRDDDKRRKYRNHKLNTRDRAKERARRNMRENDYLAKLRARYETQGHKADFIRVIPIRVRIMVWDILGDPSGRAASIYLRRAHNRTLAAILKRAAGDTRNSRARKIVALGLAMISLSEDTERAGRWRRIVRGFPQGAFAGLLSDPFTHEPISISSLRGQRSEKDIGYLDALENYDFLYAQQLPLSEVEPFEALGIRSLNRYWLHRDIVEPLTPAEAAEAAELAEVYAAATDGGFITGALEVAQTGLNCPPLLSPAPDG